MPQVKTVHHDFDEAVGLLRDVLDPATLPRTHLEGESWERDLVRDLARDLVGDPHRVLGHIVAMAEVEDPAEVGVAASPGTYAAVE